MTTSTIFKEDGTEGDQYKLPSEKKAARVRITPELMRAIRKIESGGNPNAVTGSYKGLYQLSDSEFKRLGGRGSIFNGPENERIAALKLQREADQVAAKLGRELTPGEIYLVHQQGTGGAYAHLTNPDRPAWQSMNTTGEGRSKGEKWSRLAIWGNVPDKDKARYGSVDNLTSGEFTRLWSERIARGGGGSGGTEPAAVQPTSYSSPESAAAAAEAAKPKYSSPESAAAAAATEPAAPIAAEPDPTLQASIAKVDPKYGNAVGEGFEDLGKIFAQGPVAQNAARASGPANLPVPMAPAAPGVQPMVDPRQAEAQRQQLAMAMQRLNSGKLF